MNKFHLFFSFLLLLFINSLSAQTPLALMARCTTCFTISGNSVSYAIMGGSGGYTLYSNNFSTLGVSSDFTMSFTMGNGNNVSGTGIQGATIGITNSSVVTDWYNSQIDYGIVVDHYFQYSSNYAVQEKGVRVYTLNSPVTIGDVLSIKKTGTTITYLRNGSVFYTSSVAATYSNYYMSSNWGNCNPMVVTNMVVQANSSVVTSPSGSTRNKYRTINGTLNNLTTPNSGASGIPLLREIPSEYADGKNTLAGANRPTPRLISNQLSNEPEDVHNDRGMSGLFYIWGQFLDHDITLTPSGTESAPISLPSNEKIFTSPIPFTRSAPHPGTGITTPREHTNLQTSWIDGSQVYGFTPQIANWLRTFQGGKLKVSVGNMLPFNTVTGEYDGALDPTAPKMDDDNGRTKKTFAAGDPRAAEHPGLTSLHTLFVREHNKICDRLKSQYPTMSDEDIYQKARKEIGALIQHITYKEWLPALGVQLNTYTGYKQDMKPDISNLFSTAAYRWHTMVENDIIFRDNDCHGVGPVELPLKDVFFNISIVRKYDIGVLLKGLSVHRQYETDLKVNNGLRNFLFGPGSGLDLVSLNIQRGRDHGLPNYNTVRKIYTGTAATTFSEIASHDTIAQKMQALYSNVNNIDLWVGLYAEPRLAGKSVGKTVDAILRNQLERLRDGDYYFYQNDTELSASLASIQATKLKDIISRNSSAGNFQDNVFFRKSCSSSGDDIAKYSCSVTPQYDGWTYIGQTGLKKYYRWNGGAVNFNEAKRLAVGLGGNLPQINNAIENNALKTYIAGSNAWLDLNRVGSQWKYSNTFNASDILVNGIVAPYYSWSAGEPNNYGAIENRAEIMSTGLWNDVSETSLKSVVAEITCESDCTTDVVKPVLSACPANQTLTTTNNACKATTWTVPTATDNCGIPSVTSSHASGFCFPVGTTTVTYTAKDSKNNTATCRFTVTVTNSAAPTTCGGNPDQLIWKGNIDYVAIGGSMSMSEDRSNCGQYASSSKILTIPTGATIKAAYLYWSGSGALDNAVTLNGYSVTAQGVKTYYEPTWGMSFFGARADVSNIVKTASTYSVSNLTWNNTGNYCFTNSAYGAWSMVVVYEQAGLTYSTVHINTDNFRMTYPAGNYSSAINCINVPVGCASNAKMTIIAFEGDAYKGEYLYINGAYQGDNFFRGSSGPNLDIQTFNVANHVYPGTTSLSYNFNSYLSYTVWGNAIEGLFDYVKVLKYNTCSLTSNLATANAVLDMQAHAETNRSHIEWVNNYGFETDFFVVEKMNEKSGQFEKMSTLNAFNSDQNEHYLAYDNNPHDGDNIYRIAANRYDGSIRYSEPKKVSFNNLFDVRVFPNPADEVLNIDLKAYEGRAVGIQIYNTLGKLIVVKQVDKASASPIQMPTNEMPVGSYLIRLLPEGKREVTKQVKIAR